MAKYSVLDYTNQNQQDTKMHMPLTTMAFTIRNQTVNNSSINDSVKISIWHRRAIDYNLIKNYPYMSMVMCKEQRHSKMVFFKVGKLL